MPTDETTRPSLSDRKAAIARAMESAGDRSHFIPTEEGYLEVPVTEVPVDMLVYRVDNGRILSELAEAARQQGATVEDWRQSPDSAEVQDRLHALLLAKARDPRGSIHDELERFGRQTEPLLIRRDGLVLNGNRRLAAMRALYESDPDRFAGFAQARAGILPEGLSEEDLEFIEAALQMAPELKLDYSWINRRLKLREHVRDMGRDRVATAYRLSDPAEIDRELGELELAEGYLHWCGAPGHFALVEDAEEHFIALHAQLDEMKQERRAALWRRIGFAMIRAAPDLDAKILHYFPFTAPRPPAIQVWVPRTMAEDRGMIERQAEGENKPLDEATARRLEGILDDPTHAVTVAQTALALMDTIRGDTNRIVGVARLMNQLRAARQTLQDMEIEQLAPGQRRRLQAELAALQEFLGEETGPPPRAAPSGRGRQVRTLLSRMVRRAKR